MDSAALVAAAGPFLLALSRVAGFFVTVPFFGSGSIPMEARAGLVFLITVLLFPFVRPVPGPPPESVLVFTLAIVFESLLGMLLGFAANLLVEGFRLSGEMLGVQVGFGMISVLDPESLVEESLLDVFYFFLFLLVFLIGDFHHRFLEAMAASFRLIPAGGIAYPPAFLNELIGRSGAFFGICLRLSIPVVAPLVIITVVLGIVSKTVPRMEVFMISFPIKIFLGFLFFLGLLPRVIPYTERLLQELMRWIARVLPALAG